MSEENGERTKILSDMNKELHKRLEEAAIKSWTQGYREHQFKDCYPSQEGFYKRGFSEGVDWMLKECREQMLEQCKEWLRNNVHRYIYAVNKDGIPQAGIGAAVFAEDFEKDMNKLWEETK